jgi:peptidoglycan L-alanyl-D-glutamate endopeptidase CwlK
MRPPSLVNRDLQRLAPLLPEFRTIVLTVLEQMDRLGFPMTVTAGARTQLEQVELFKKGRKLVNGLWVPIDPVHLTGIVTNADGVKKPSNHQLKSDGFGYAVDSVFLIDGPDRDGELETPSWDEHHPFGLYGEMGKALGRGRVVWGGDWTSPHDAPHLEWRAA